MTHDERKINAEKAFNYLTSYCKSQPFNLTICKLFNNPLVIETNFTCIYDFILKNLDGLQWISIEDGKMKLQF